MSGRISLRLRARRWQTRVKRTAARVFGFNKTVYVDSRVPEYRGYWSAAARLIGAEFKSLTESIWEVRLGERTTRVSNYVVAADDPVTLRVAGDKVLCHSLAQSAGAKVPEHLAFTLNQLTDVRARVASDAGPWVIKPAAGSYSALGVTTGITRAAQVEAAAVLASLESPRLMLEKMIPGESCRFLYLDGVLISAVRRRGTRVTGDGKNTVAALARQQGLLELLDDAVCLLTLRAQRLEQTSVPALGRAVLLTGTPREGRGQREFRTIYDEPITHLVHPAVAESMGAVVRAIGSRFAGVDVITVDPALPLELTNGGFLELNTTPGIHHHYHTEEDRHTHPVAVAVLESLLRPREQNQTAAATSVFRKEPRYVVAE
jgi:cyanophycin synthetase